ncbi:MAG: hypothetical protein FJW23_05715 [Acidimicrobiia bacterium]|nr:hypothetical protein [Acidimicrobiia bacterium]
MRSATGPPLHSIRRGRGGVHPPPGAVRRPRATRARTFVQLDVLLPFYALSSTTYTHAGPVSLGRRYSPSIIVLLGVGWQRGRQP